MYKLVFGKNTLREFDKLKVINKKRIWDKLQFCKETPFHFLEPLIQVRGFKLRVSDYRIIIDVDNQNKILKIIKIGHRKNIYET